MWMGPLGQMVMARPHQGWQAMQPPFDPLGTFVQRAENHAHNRGHSAMATAAIAKTSKAAPFPWAAEDIRRIFTAGRVFPLPLLAMYRHRCRLELCRIFPVFDRAFSWWSTKILFCEWRHRSG